MHEENQEMQTYAMQHKNYHWIKAKCMHNESNYMERKLTQVQEHRYLISETVPWNINEICHRQSRGVQADNRKV